MQDIKFEFASLCALGYIPDAVTVKSYQQKYKISGVKWG